MGGPIWSDQIHDIDFIDALLTRVEDWKHLGTFKRIKTTLDAIKKEMSIGNYPLNLEFEKIASDIRSESISKQQIFSAFKSLNFDLVQSYYKPSLYKTNAPNIAIYDVFKAWKEKCCEGKDKEITDKCHGVALSILSKPIQFRPDFEFEAAEIKSELKQNKVRYNHNPPNWGPGNRANANVTKKAEKKAADKEKEASEEN